MRSRRPITSHRLLALLSAIVIGVSLSACAVGSKPAHPAEGQEDGTASSGFYVDAGRITYQVQISRELNLYDNEDKAYVAGVCNASLTPSQEWFGVFLWAKNQSRVPATTTGNVTITDTQGNTYYPMPFGCGGNPIAWAPQLLRPQQTEPMQDTPASYDLAQGGLLLFKVNASVYANRPLTLNIYAPGRRKPAQVSLDL